MVGSKQQILKGSLHIDEPALFSLGDITWSRPLPQVYGCGFMQTQFPGWGLDWEPSGLLPTWSDMIYLGWDVRKQRQVYAPEPPFRESSAFIWENYFEKSYGTDGKTSCSTTRMQGRKHKAGDEERRSWWRNKTEGRGMTERVSVSSAAVTKQHRLVA